jgi:hypothetical protein
LTGGAGKNAKLDVTTEKERNICIYCKQKAGNNYIGAAKPIARNMLQGSNEGPGVRRNMYCVDTQRPSLRRRVIEAPPSAAAAEGPPSPKLWVRMVIFTPAHWNMSLLVASLQNCNVGQGRKRVKQMS